MLQKYKKILRKEDIFFELGNFQKLISNAKKISPLANLNWVEQTAKHFCNRWVLLGLNHLRIAKKNVPSNKQWRATVSRSYYAAYNVSKAVRYWCDGSVRRDGEDHRYVGDIPKDFPFRNNWENFLTELRYDRNIADYDPWKNVNRRLNNAPNYSFGKTYDFVKAGRLYLRQRGVIS